MGFGRVDRGGSREGKKSSLRNNKQEIQKKLKDSFRGIMSLAPNGPLTGGSPTPPPLSITVLETAADAAKRANALRDRAIAKATAAICNDNQQDLSSNRNNDKAPSNATAPNPRASGPGYGGAFGGFDQRPPDVGGHLLLPDCAVQLVSRQFDRDQAKVLQRAVDSGVAPLIAFSTDFDKAESLVLLARDNPGLVYCCVGVHSDNVKRTNERLSTSRLEELRVLCLRPETVAVLCGIDLSRDVGVRYAQERAMTDQMAAAVEVGLPLLLYEVQAADVLVEKIQEFRDGSAAAAKTRIAIHNFCGSMEEARAYVDLGCMVMVSGRICDPTSEKSDTLRAAISSAVPLDRLMLASDSPMWTPQNIPDLFVREGRNEPSNLPYAAMQLAQMYGMGIDEMCQVLYQNAMHFYGIPEEASVDIKDGEQEGEQQDRVKDANTNPDDATQKGSVEEGEGGASLSSGAISLQESGATKSKPKNANKASAQRGKPEQLLSVKEEKEEEEEMEENERQNQDKYMSRKDYRQGRKKREKNIQTKKCGKKGKKGDEDDEDDEEDSESSSLSSSSSSSDEASDRCSDDESEISDDDEKKVGSRKKKSDANRKMERNVKQTEKKMKKTKREGPGKKSLISSSDNDFSTSSCSSSSSSDTDDEDSDLNDVDEEGTGVNKRGNSDDSETDVIESQSEHSGKDKNKHLTPITHKSRALFACRGCRKTLFDGDTVAPPHAATEFGVRADLWKRDIGGGGKGNSKNRSRRNASRNVETALCNQYLLQSAALPPWVTKQVKEASDLVGSSCFATEGRLCCPFCETKLGKWAVNSIVHPSENCGLTCTCGALFPAPAYGILKTRVDLIDTQRDVEAAAQSVLQDYEEEEKRREDMDTFLSMASHRSRAVHAAGTVSFFQDEDEEEDEEGEGKKKRNKIRGNKTANFSSFRNKSYVAKMTSTEKEFEKAKEKEREREKEKEREREREGAEDEGEEEKGMEKKREKTKGEEERGEQGKEEVKKEEKKEDKGRQEGKGKSKEKAKENRKEVNSSDKKENQESHLQDEDDDWDMDRKGGKKGKKGNGKGSAGGVPAITSVAQVNVKNVVEDDDNDWGKGSKGGKGGKGKRK
mmetsp:Transcript_4079/g.7245  ORF Transcript_4079/g.7245 Transcript_4079/m.7245 type:complete len:1106 (-) Transcript_4079:1874-5191(-)|eukprot:CAMPEP_0175052092 /NCGR_PEP_ID=MMETSP0052_2-20121109/8168_1 /TAXON_ID=51329 ORGANISM="Polytomella parva, Strain SAG 63-3" /NCGR_SAMPLE_ID=MMETSP0052_2 /ASSEMBLY_ACC=CAM_ASM_000194 /LENGTH=1105 /DNA_ID=CAMNT_0016316459 /DNA_START=52 /DNA_END=3369 /DNA_ORIENTATION=-